MQGQKRSHYSPIAINSNQLSKGPVSRSKSESTYLGPWPYSHYGQLTAWNRPRIAFFVLWISGLLQAASFSKGRRCKSSALKVREDNSFYWRWSQWCAYDQDCSYRCWTIWWVGHGLCPGKWLRSALVQNVVETIIGAWKMELHAYCIDDSLLLLQKYAVYPPSVCLRLLLRVLRTDSLRWYLHLDV